MQSLSQLMGDPAHASLPAVTDLRTGAAASYGEIWRRACRLSEALRRCAVHNGTRVLPLISDRAWFEAAIVACSMQRTTSFVPLDSSCSQSRFQAIARRVAHAVVVTDRRPPFRLGADVILVDELPEVAAPAAPESCEPAPQSDLLMIPSSDATRFSVVSEDSALWAARALVERYAIDASDRILTPASDRDWTSFSVTASAILPLVAKAHLVVSSSDPEALELLWDNAERWQATVAVLPPHWVSGLLAQRPRSAPRSLRFFLTGGAPLPEVTWRRFEEAFATRVHVVYGHAETCGVATSTVEANLLHGSVGTPLGGGVKIAIAKPRAPGPAVLDLSEPTMPRPLAGGSRVGEILLSGPMLMRSFHKARRLTQASLNQEQFFRTGDLGFVDSSGSLVVTGKISEIIVRRGFRVSAQVIDECLARHPQVRECKTFGVPDPVGRARVHSVCVVGPPEVAESSGEHRVVDAGARSADGDGATGEALLAWAAARLPPEMQPDAVTVMGYLPRHGAGRIDTVSLVNIVTGQTRAQIVMAFNARRFRRSPPSRPDDIAQLVDAALCAGRPLRLACYWGAGPRAEVEDVDRRAIDRMRDFASAGALLPEAPVELTLVLADTHAQLNGIPAQMRIAYFDGIRKYAERLSGNGVSIKCQILSQLCSAAGVDQEIDQEPDPELAETVTLDDLPILARIHEFAQSHYAGDPRIGARRYYLQCRREAPIVTAAHAGSIWLTFNDPELDVLLPDLPKIYLYSYKPGRSRRPWFFCESPRSS